MVVAYKWGGIAFDDKSLIKTLILPSNAYDNVPITLHYNGVNYQVPAGKVFIVGRAMWAVSIGTLHYGRVGESGIADGAISKEVLILNPHPTAGSWVYDDVIGIYTAGKYVTGETSSTTYYLYAGSTLYGVEIPA